MQLLPQVARLTSSLLTPMPVRSEAAVILDGAVAEDGVQVPGTFKPDP